MDGPNLKMNMTTVGEARRRRRRSAGLRDAASLLGGALLGTSVVLPILAGGEAVDRDTLVLFVSGLLAVLGIGMHVSASARSVRVLQRTASAPSAGAEEYPRSARARRESGADARLIV